MSTIDREQAAVLVALAPLDSRCDAVRRQVVEQHEFDARDLLDMGWSSGERVLVSLAALLWKGHGDVDLDYIVTMLGGRFRQAAFDAMAARSGQDIRTDGASAQRQALIALGASA